MNGLLLKAEKDRQKLDEAFAQADTMIMRKYMSGLLSLPVKMPDEMLETTELNCVLRLNKLEKIVYDAEEDNLDKLLNVYHSVALCEGTIVHIIVCDGEKVEYYLGTRTESINEAAACQSVLTGTFEGNFPGSKIIRQEKKEVNECMDRIFSPGIGGQNRIVSAVSGIPGMRREEGREFIQGMEKLIDSMGNQRYALITIAEPMKQEKVMEIKESYEDLYSQLSPFSKSVQTYSETDSSAVAESITEAITESVGNTISNTVNESKTVSEGKTASKGRSLLIFSRTKGSSQGISEQRGSSLGESSSESRASSRTTGSTDTRTETSGRTLQLSYENRRVSDLLRQIEKQIERIEDAKDTGLWNAATYCLADDVQTSRMLASAMQSLCRGRKSTIENYSVTTWTEQSQLIRLHAYLKKMRHPCFAMETDHSLFAITPASLVNGRELVVSAGLPRKSVRGVSISRMVPFARNIVIEGEYEQKDKICIGNIYHMGNVEPAKVYLDPESLSSHVLITGSTGSGKSNAVYALLAELRKKGKKFLVIEPAKGEYKHVFGNEPDVHVFGTNSRWSEMLRINPFSFPEEIHLLEHIDRLIEIFTVCWPMYAAMPAVLKDAVIKSYQCCGWNLNTSQNRYGKRFYPTCQDLQKQIVRVIDSSAYSEEVKGDYIGSLATRVRSLTNGINGQILSAEELEETILFQENTIVDLSRVGSQETKALLMGILVMKLTEYRIAQADGAMNQPLNHVTVLEEAHHLLRNTGAAASSSEEGNLAGKSVEMLSHSIAEMRTYGEGFIIVDQSPGALDISAIRNTNTKILMRLPEEKDRQQAGRSAAMTEKQIPELARLPRGVAVVYQNNWLDPVLCKIQKALLKEETYRYPSALPMVLDEEEKRIRRLVLMLLVGSRMDEELEIDAEDIRAHLKGLHLSTESRIAIEQALDMLEEDKMPGILKETSFTELSRIVGEVLEEDSFKLALDSIENEEELQQQIGAIILEAAGPVSEELEFASAQCIIRNLVSENPEKIELYGRWRSYAVSRRKKEEKGQTVR